MTKSVEILGYLKKYPVFNTAILRTALNKDTSYTTLFLHRLKKSGKIFEIERNKYTAHNDPFLIASRIIWPSYISGWSALSYYQLTEQVPHSIWVVCSQYKKPITFLDTEIIFIKTKGRNLFGFKKVAYKNFEIFIAEPEKAIVDAALLKKISFSELREIISSNIQTLNLQKFLYCLKRICNKSLIKRFGFVFESLGYDYYKRMKKYVDLTYIPLDYSKNLEHLDGKRNAKRNNKWRLIINA